MTAVPRTMSTNVSVYPLPYDHLLPAPHIHEHKHERNDNPMPTCTNIRECEPLQTNDSAPVNRWST